MMRFVAAVLLGAVLVHFAALAALPRVIMHLAMTRMQRAPVNEFAHGPLATSEARAIVRPSPDLAYSVIVYDVSEGDLVVTVPVTAPYTSISGFAANTDNFFAINDQTAPNREEIRVILTDWESSMRPATDAEGTEFAGSPSDTGILLVRRVVAGPEAFAEVDAVRRKSTTKFFPRNAP